MGVRWAGGKEEKAQPGAVGPEPAHEAPCAGGCRHGCARQHLSGERGGRPGENMVGYRGIFKSRASGKAGLVVQLSGQKGGGPMKTRALWNFNPWG